MKGRKTFQEGGMTVVSNAAKQFIKTKVNGDIDEASFSGTKPN